MMDTRSIIIRYSLIFSLIVPTLYSLSTSSQILEPFTARSVIHSHRLYLLLFSPWSSPLTLLNYLSRILQLIILLAFPTSTWVYGYAYIILLNLVRTVVGFVLSRSVGWAYPTLFSHWALYELSSGLGPAVLLGIAVLGPEVLLNKLPTLPPWTRHTVLPALTLVYAWSEYAPWTYGISTLLIACLEFLSHAIRPRIALYSPIIDTYPESLDEKAPIHPGPASSMGFSLLTVLLPYFFLVYLPAPLRLPLSTSPDPLLDIIVLSYPRPVDTPTAASIIATTLSSFVPFISPSISLSVFTHAPYHPSLDLIKPDFPNITFYTDTDSYPNYAGNHYLHLAELFRWAKEVKKGEWVLLVEDDFPVCDGKKGWEVVETVLAMLEERKKADEGDIGSGFIGTGGSGLIIHHTSLPLLSHLLLTYSSLSLLPQGIHRPPPDVLIQDCLLGRPGSVCQRDNPDKGRMIISSRLVLDHIGGMATTTLGKEGNRDKWRCGWRSGLHGEEGVDVVVV